MKISFRPIAGNAPWTWLLLITVGCDDPSAVQPGDVRTYLAPTAPTAAAPRPTPSSAAGMLSITYNAPDGWTDRGASGMRLATLAIDDGAREHEVTVIPAAGTLEANVSRWLGQLDPAATPESLIERTARVVAEAKKLPVRDAEATLVTLMEQNAQDDEEVILGAMIPFDRSSSLFVKFKGPAEVARREQEAFSQFVSSIRWNEDVRR